tara:strand:+ start:47 stop:271 length:225 start_codon:yes stop_codon:yes gene_type:complete
MPHKKESQHAKRMGSTKKRVKDREKIKKAKTMGNWNRLKMQGVVKGFGPPSSRYGSYSGTNTSLNKVENKQKRG